ncbi:MAG TPA: hypothetical protein VK528_00695 [Flavobacterium sp.]|nr:hypothetical protein [Flavobacterium sp.]
MKKVLLLFLLLCCVEFAMAQDTAIEIEAMVYRDSVVDIKPEFPGGIENCYKYFAKNFTLPNAKGLVDKVVLSFIIEPDGTLTDIRVIHDAGFGTGPQIAKLLETGPKWIPGEKDGKKVRVFHTLPIPVITEE